MPTLVKSLQFAVINVEGVGLGNQFTVSRCSDCLSDMKLAYTCLPLCGQGLGGEEEAP